MRNYFTALIIVLLGLGAGDLQATPREHREMRFLVVNSMRIKDVAAAFHTDARALASANHMRKRQVAYPGKELRIPVWLKKKASGNEGKESREFSLSDYEINRDSVEYAVFDDFLWINQIERDTVRRTQIGKQIKTIDRQIANNYSKLDSIENSKDGIEYDPSKDTDNRLAIQKMMAARNKFQGIEALHAENDKLLAQKNQLMAERSKINDRILQFEALVENAAYEAAHPNHSAATFQLNEPADRYSTPSKN
ncbi:MAG: LysM peptidoglycan-binding domain-containing protein [Chitinophagales bacterium]